MSEVEANFKNINKNIIWIGEDKGCIDIESITLQLWFCSFSVGQSLYNNKEVKDLFVNVVDKIVEPVRQYKLSSEDLTQFLTAYLQAVTEGSLAVDKELVANFSKFMKTLTVIILTFYKS